MRGLSRLLWLGFICQALAFAPTTAPRAARFIPVDGAVRGRDVRLSAFGAFLQRPLGTAAMVHFGDLVVRTLPAAQPAEEERWVLQRCNGSKAENCGAIEFQLSGSVASVKTFEIDIAHAPLEEVVSFSFDLESDEVSIDDEAEEVSRFVLAVLGARLRRLDAEKVFPEELSPMIRIANEALACPGAHKRPLLTASNRVHVRPERKAPGNPNLKMCSSLPQPMRLQSCAATLRVAPFWNWHAAMRSATASTTWIRRAATWLECSKTDVLCRRVQSERLPIDGVTRSLERSCCVDLVEFRAEPRACVAAVPLIEPVQKWLHA